MKFIFVFIILAVNSALATSFSCSKYFLDGVRVIDHKVPRDLAKPDMAILDYDFSDWAGPDFAPLPQGTGSRRQGIVSIFEAVARQLQAQRPGGVLKWFDASGNGDPLATALERTSAKWERSTDLDLLTNRESNLNASWDFQIVTDFFGPLSTFEDFAWTINRDLNLLSPGGKLLMVTGQATHLQFYENGRNYDWREFVKRQIENGQLKGVSVSFPSSTSMVMSKIDGVAHWSTSLSLVASQGAYGHHVQRSFFNLRRVYSYDDNSAPSICRNVCIEGVMGDVEQSVTVIVKTQDGERHAFPLQGKRSLPQEELQEVETLGIGQTHGSGQVLRAVSSDYLLIQSLGLNEVDASFNLVPNYLYQAKDWAQGDFTRLPYANGRFKTVVSLGGFFSVVSPETPYLKELFLGFLSDTYRVLQASGNSWVGPLPAHLQSLSSQVEALGFRLTPIERSGAIYWKLQK